MFVNLLNMYNCVPTVQALLRCEVDIIYYKFIKCQKKNKIKYIYVSTCSIIIMFFHVIITHGFVKKKIT